MVARSRLARAQPLARPRQRGAEMTLLLASVTGSEEAEVVLAHGADVIDLKDPAAGALGGLPHDVVRAAVAAIAGRRRVSAVRGDVPMRSGVVSAAVGAMGA